MTKQSGLFDLENRDAQLSKAGDPLEKSSNVVNVGAFRYRLNKVLQHGALKRSDGHQEGRLACDVVLVFKILPL